MAVWGEVANLSTSGKKNEDFEKNPGFSKTPNCFLKTPRRFTPNAEAFCLKCRNVCFSPRKVNFNKSTP